MKSLDVLFLGNSYTHCNRMPWIVRELAMAAGQARPLELHMVAPGGVTLEFHAGNPESLEALTARPWDFVVLQDHSLGPVERAAAMMQYGRELGKRIHDVGAQPVLYLTWARQHLPDMQRMLDEGYLELADKIGARVAPVGPAWERTLNQHSDCVLHTEDKSHPTPMGSYLAACVFYAVLYDASPEGLPGAITVDEEGITALPQEQAVPLQTIAWEMAQGSAYRRIG